MNHFSISPLILYIRDPNLDSSKYSTLSHFFPKMTKSEKASPLPLPRVTSSNLRPESRRSFKSYDIWEVSGHWRDGRDNNNALCGRHVSLTRRHTGLHSNRSLRAQASSSDRISESAAAICPAHCRFKLTISSSPKKLSSGNFSVSCRIEIQRSIHWKWQKRAWQRHASSASPGEVLQDGAPS